MAIVLAACDQDHMDTLAYASEDKDGVKHIAITAHGTRWRMYANKPIEIPEGTIRRVMQRVGRHGSSPVKLLCLNDEGDRDMLLRTQIAEAIKDETEAAEPQQKSSPPEKTVIRALIPPVRVLSLMNKSELRDLLQHVPGCEVGDDIKTKEDLIGLLESMR